jgi:hypothetical protein
MLALNRSLLNSLGFDHFCVQSPCNFLIGDYTELFYSIYKWDVLPIHFKMGLRWLTTARKVDPLNLIFINFNIPVLTPVSVELSPCWIFLTKPSFRSVTYREVTSVKMAK